MPVARTLDGAVVYDQERVDVVPTGREIDLQLAYQRPLGGGTDVAGWAMVRREPGHDADAGMAYGVGMKLDVEF